MSDTGKRYNLALDANKRLKELNVIKNEDNSSCGFKCEICSDFQENKLLKYDVYIFLICDQCKSDLKDYVTWKRNK